MAENKEKKKNYYPEATKKYEKKAYDRILVRVYKGQKRVIQDFAAKGGESLNSFIKRAIDEAMGRDEN